MRWIVKLKLFFTDSRSKTSSFKNVVLILLAVLMLQLNWRLQYLSLSDSFQTSGLDDFLSCSKDGEIITKTSVREIGDPLTKKVFLTIGIPTVQRTFQNKTTSYLMETLNSLLINGSSEEELKNILIVVFLADTEESARINIMKELRSNFGTYLNMNIIHVISAPPSFYPRLKGLQSTLGDGPDRMHWRSKQVMDYVFMLYYSQGLAQYYLQLEDDVTVVPNALSQIREFIDLKGDTKWGILAFSRWGFIGKLIHDNDLRLIGRYLEMFYNEMPCDWLLYIYLQSRGAINILDDKSNTWTKELFLHVGHQSSSLGT